MRQAVIWMYSKRDRKSEMTLRTTFWISEKLIFKLILNILLTLKKVSSSNMLFPITNLKMDSTAKMSAYEFRVDK